MDSEQTYVACIGEIRTAVMEIGVKGDGDHAGVSSALSRSLGLRELLQAHEAGELTPERMIANRWAIHDALGWGYDTRLGAALAKLYQLKLGPMLEEAIDAVT